MKTRNFINLALWSLVLIFVFMPGHKSSMAQNPAAPANPAQVNTEQSQNTVVYPTAVSYGTFLGATRPLREIPPSNQKERNRKKFREEYLNPTMKYRSYPNADHALPIGEDPVAQKQMGTLLFDQSQQVNFDGQSAFIVPDDNGTAGPDHYMQTINSTYAIYDKSGILQAGPTNLNELFEDVPGAEWNDGDPIVMYDEQAGRWLVAEFSIPSAAPNYILVAVSETDDPTGSWYPYSFELPAMPDYPKFGVWRDGYYVGVNNTEGKNDIFVLERSKMILGETAQMVSFKNPYRPGLGGFMVVPPVDNDGAFAPEGSPGQFVAFNDDAWNGFDQLWIYELAVNWTNPQTSTFRRSQQIDVASFSSDFGSDWNNIRQKGKTQKLDAVNAIIMNMPQYRNFGSYQTLVCNHTVNVDGKGRAGVRWYELRKTDALWTIRQQSTYTPDTNSRWMASILLNGENKIGLGYSISSLGEYPGIRFCGQSSTSYLAGNSTLDIAESTIWAGNYSQDSTNRWGDYTSLAIDPTDDKTFWYTNEYIMNDNKRATRIASFAFESPVSVNPAESNENSLFRVFPNPSQGIFTITPQNDAVPSLDVQVYDLAGRLVFEKQYGSQNEYILDLSQAKSGIYTLRLQSLRAVQTIKLIKQ